MEGLQHLHSHDIIHCDVKPENAMVLGSIDDESAHLRSAELLSRNYMVLLADC